MNTQLLIDNPIRNILPALEQGWFALGRLAAKAYAGLLLDMDVHYQSPIPMGAKLLAANHPTTCDPVLLTTLVPEQVSILISETLFKVPVLGASLRTAGHIEVIHSNGKPALLAGISYLQAGRTVGIFPEGAISPESGLAKAHTGAARLAIATGVPVIPVGIALERKNIYAMATAVDGKHEVANWYLHGKYAMTVGKAVVYRGSVEDRACVRAATEDLMSRIERLSQESSARIHAQNSHSYTNSDVIPRIPTRPGA